jgi:hypothetical protein
MLLQLHIAVDQPHCGTSAMPLLLLLLLTSQSTALSCCHELQQA